jgi:hypothetical protein
MGRIDPPHRRSRSRVRRAIVGLLACVLGIGIALALYALTRDDPRHPIPLALPSEIAGPDPLSFDPGDTSAYERAAAFGLSHVLFAKSPGGVVAAASRTAAFRSLVEDAVSGSDIDADLVEAIVFLESAGRPDVIAGDDPEHAAGLTQILAETGANFLGMQVDLAASRSLTRQIAEAQGRGDASAVLRLQSERRRVDERFDPAHALAGTVRYLSEARRHFGRDDLALVSYHMGIGNLEGVLRAYSGRKSDPIGDVVREDDLSYARLYFDSSPIDHPEAWQRLASFGDDSQTYYWRVLAAREIMRLVRVDPARLERLARLHGHGPSAELVLHPPQETRRLATPGELEAAIQRGRLQRLPDDPTGLHFRVDPRLPATVRDLGRDPATFAALRPRSLRFLRYLARKVYELSDDERPLTVTRTVYDEAAGAVLTPPDVAKKAHASVHATGFAFDVRRRYGSGSQAAAFQWTLERLQALGLIAWTRGKSVIHVAVSPRADVAP